MGEQSTARLQGLLGPPRAVDRLPAGAVRELSSQLAVKDLPSEVRILAKTFIALQLGGEPVADQRRAWHHLLMGVANSRSRAGNLHLAARSGGAQGYLDEVGEAEAESLVVPPPAGEPSGGALKLGADDPASWAELMSSVHGLTVPTTSTLLAALWPGVHVPMDNLGVGSLVGLQAIDADGNTHEGLTIADLNNIWREVVTGIKTWPDYEWYVATLRLTMAVHAPAIGLQDVERALSLIGSKAAGYSGTQWQDWARRLNEIVATADEAWRARPG